jgi:hypothetical protein
MNGTAGPSPLAECRVVAERRSPLDLPLLCLKSARTPMHRGALSSVTIPTHRTVILRSGWPRYCATGSRRCRGCGGGSRRAHPIPRRCPAPAGRQELATRRAEWLATLLDRARPLRGMHVLGGSPAGEAAS